MELPDFLKPDTPPTDQDSMAVCAIRYAIGRRSYIVADAARWAREYGAKSAWVRSVVIRDLQEAIDKEDRGFTGALGDEMDARVWREVLSELQAHDRPLDVGATIGVPQEDR